MTIKVSTGLRNSMMTAGGTTLADALDDGLIKIYAGTVPADADAALGGATLLCIVGDAAGTEPYGATEGCDFDAASAGVLTKAAAQTWSGTNAATGTASFYRFVQQADTGVLSTTEKRIQGTVGTVSADLNLSSVSLTSGGTQTVDAYSVTMPTA